MTDRESRPSGLLDGQTDPAFRKACRGLSKDLRTQYGMLDDSPASAVPPQPAERAAAASGGAAATPGQARFAPVAGLTGTSPSQPPGQQEGSEGEAQTSRPGRAAQDAAPGTGASGLRGEEWAAEVRKAEAALHKAQRNRRGKWKPKGSNPFGKASGVRIPPPGDGAA